MDKPELTFGGSRIRVSFNPSNDSLVDWFKGKTADLIDKLHENRTWDSDPEYQRLLSLAQTAYEEAAMWAVKAATFGK